MSKYIAFLLMGILILWVGCSDTGVNPDVPDHHFVLEGNTPIPGQNSGRWWTSGGANKKSKKDDLPQLSKDKVNKLYKLLDKYTKRKKSPYAAFLSRRKAKKNNKKDKKDKFKYRYFKLHPPQAAIEEAGEERTFYFHIFVDPSNNEVYQILAVLVPDTPEQLQAVKEWGDKLNSKSKSRGSAASKYPLMTSCTVHEGLIWVPECGCFGLGTIEVCADSDDGGGGGGGGGDDPSDCYYDPGGCEEDQDPDYDGGGGDPDPCPTGQVEDPNGNCVAGEVPCVGNPLKNPRIAAQTNSGIEGGRFGHTRNRPKPHNGTDLKVAHGEAIFSMYEGQILRTFYDPDGWGQFVIVKYPNVNGKEVWTVYAHLNNISVEEGDPVTPGTVLGTAGISGNLGTAIRKGYTSQHLHIETRIGGWGDKEPQNPEDYLTTQFDNNGNPVSGTDC